MARSPSHRLGQIIGDFLEVLIQERLEDFCRSYNANALTETLFLDKKGSRAVRSGLKLTWLDNYANAHDLDFVIERGGTANKLGHPVAFIESAWRRYTKHSRNKAQEIQGAVIPIAEKYAWDAPFLGVFLAGVFTDSSIEQMKSVGFTVSLFPYETIVEAFLSAGIDIAFDENTTDEHLKNLARRLDALDSQQWDMVKGRILALNASQLESFFTALDNALNKGIERLTLTPLHGRPYEFETARELAAFVRDYTSDAVALPLTQYEIFVRYTNGSEIRSLFREKEEIFRFLEYISNSVASEEPNSIHRI